MSIIIILQYVLSKGGAPLQSQPRQRRSQRSRAQYPEDTMQPAYPTYPEYPSAPPQNDWQQPQGNYSAPPSYPQNAYYQPPQTSYPAQGQYSRFAPQQPPQPPRPPRGNAYEGGEPLRRRKSHDGLWLLLIIVCIVLLAGGGFMVSALHSTHYPAFKQKLAVMQGDRFYNGVHVDGVHIGGMTMDEARSALSQQASYADQQFSLAVTVDDKTWRITQSELPLSRNTEAVLQEAFTIGRQGAMDTLGTSTTPFEARYQHVWQTNQTGAYLYTEITYDKATARHLSQIIADSMYVQPVDASIYDFDFETRSFRFTPEQAGKAIDVELVYAHIIAYMDSRNYNAAIKLNTEAITPAVTADVLGRSFGRLSTYTTTTTADKNRNTNIKIAAQAVTGTKMESGDVFSFNKATGKRTVDKGYLPADAIAGGVSMPDTGGGVCQVSSTLFNAAMLANMEIVYSSRHAWPSTYVDPGRDATVDWQSWQTLEQSLDFKFKNSSDYPIYIVAYMTGNNLNRACTCTVEIYGVAFQEGITVDVVTELVSHTPAPIEPEMIFDETLAYGTEKVYRKARDGYTYITYRVYYQNGVEIGREEIRKSAYPVYTQQIKYNW